MAENDFAKQIEFLRRCKESVTYFIETCVKIQHPTIGILPFKLFKYQKNSLGKFRKHRFNVFRKCRQSGVSTETGAYALWVGMFFNHKKILITSKVDRDAKEFLARNIKFPYDNLPDWMKELFPITANDHEIEFKNGSVIRSLPAAPNALRSNASSLNIIDEAAFIDCMDEMWAAGYSTLQHGGSVIVVSTPLGIGNWYWDTWTSAVDGTNNFNPIRINWWDMDWALEYVDPILKTPMRICPTDGIRPCTTKEDLEKYGEFWSPWLENEYKNLQRKGESYKFKQEILAEFVGSGGTVLSGSALKLMERTAKKHNDEHQIVTEPVEYIDSRTGEVEYLDLRGHDNNEGLWVWNEPITSTPNEFKNGSIVTKGIPGHTYILGADIATGRDNDFSAIEIFDVDTMEQVAEYMARVSTSIFVKIIDYLGRYYNNAVVCPDRTGIGSDVVEDLLTMGYPNVWRRVKYLPAGVEYGPYGFAINDSTKPSLNKALLEHIGENAGDGYLIKSSRLWKQAQIYIRHRNSRGLDTKKIGAQTGRGNYDDLVLAASLAFVTLDSIGAWDVRALAPARLKELPMFAPAQKTAMQIMESSNDPFALMPIIPRKDDSPEEAQEADLASFTRSLIAGPRREIPAVVTRKLYLP